MKLVGRKNALCNPTCVEQSDPLPSLDSLQILSGPMLCRLHVWTEVEWAELAERDRPLDFVHVPGLGWVGALPVECLN